MRKPISGALLLCAMLLVSTSAFAFGNSFQFERIFRDTLQSTSNRPLFNYSKDDGMIFDSKDVDIHPAAVFIESVFAGSEELDSYAALASGRNVEDIRRMRSRAGLVMPLLRWRLENGELLDYAMSGKYVVLRYSLPDVETKTGPGVTDMELLARAKNAQRRYVIEAWLFEMDGNRLADGETVFMENLFAERAKELSAHVAELIADGVTAEERARLELYDSLLQKMIYVPDDRSFYQVLLDEGFFDSVKDSKKLDGGEKKEM